MKWVLIYIYFAGYERPLSMTPIEFDTQAACHFAGQQAQERIAPYTNSFRLNTFVCVPRG